MKLFFSLKYCITANQKQNGLFQNLKIPGSLLAKGVKISYTYPSYNWMWRGISKNFCLGFCQMARAGVIDVLKKHFVVCYINMKLSFMFM